MFKVTFVACPGVSTTRSRSRSKSTVESADAMPTSGPQETIKRRTQVTIEPRRITLTTDIFAMKPSRTG